MQDPFLDLHTIIKNPRRTGATKKPEDVTAVVPPAAIVTVPSSSVPTSLPPSIISETTIPSTIPKSPAREPAPVSSTTPTKKYSDDYDPFSSISTMAGIKKPTPTPAPIPAPAPAMLSMLKPAPLSVPPTIAVQAPVPAPVPAPTINDTTSNIIQPVILEPSFDDFDNFKKPEVRQATPPPPVVHIEPLIQPTIIPPKVEPEVKFDEIYRKQEEEDPAQADADFMAFNSDINTKPAISTATPSVVVIDDGLFTSFSEPTVKTTTSEVTLDEYDNLLDVFDKPKPAPAPAPVPAPASTTTINDDNYDPFESNSDKVDPFKNQKNTTIQKQQTKTRQEISHQQKSDENEYDHIEYESDDEEDDHRGSFGRLKGTAGPRDDEDELESFPKEGPILGRVSTRTLFAQKDWSDLYWTLENDVLILYRSRTDYEYNKSRAEVKKRIPIQHTHRVLKIKTKEYKGYGVLHNFMLEEVMDYGPANIAKFGGTDRQAVERLNALIKATVLKIRKSLQNPGRR